MSKYKIENAVSDLIPIFIKCGYTRKTVVELKRNIQKVMDLHKSNGEEYYNSEIVTAYISNLKEKYDSKLVSRSRKNALVKAALYVRVMATTGEIAPGDKEIECKLPLYYSNILGRLNDSENWSKSLKRNIMYATHTYFLYLVDHDILNISKISVEVIRRYVMYSADRMASNSLNTIRRNLKHLHLWLYENSFIGSDFSDILSFTTPEIRHIQRPIPHNEIALTLEAINRATDIGKRDYAMFLLAVVTGLRSVDIAGMHLSDVDWINGEIRLQQEKTGVMLALPLTVDVGEAIKDYILSGRPTSQLDIIFLTAKPPFSQLGRRGIYSAFNHVRLSVGLPQCSFHGLRRTLGTNMVVAGIPITTVAQVLGHSDISSTKQYISLDSVHLKECALDMAGISPNRGDML